MSGDQYKIIDQNAIYFVTFTVIDWVDIFTRKDYRYVIVDSLNYCIHSKGLIVYGWVIMTNHIHLILKAKEGFRLSDIIRDFKKFTAKKIIDEMQSINESRKVWMLKKFEFAGNRIKRNKKYKFWKDDNHAIILDTNKLMDQKLNYVHQNPVRALIVENPEDYIFSSAKDYSSEKGLVNIVLLI